MYKQILIAVVLMVVCVPTYGESAYYKSIKKFLDENMPGEAFLPTPYGADSRYRPKSIWVYLPDFQDNARRIDPQNAWVIASAGDLVFSGVTLHSQPINLPVRQSDLKTKLEIVAALNGTVTGGNYDADLNAAIEAGVDLEINLGEVVIEYVHYFDMVIAQDSNQRRVEALNSLVTERFGEDNPPQRVVMAALKVRGASFAVKSENAVSFGAKVKSLLGAIGFSFDRESQTYEVLRFNDWRYIAYQAKYSNDYGLISTGENPDIDDSGATNVEFSLNPPWQ